MAPSKKRYQGRRPHAGSLNATSEYKSAALNAPEVAPQPLAQPISPEHYNWAKNQTRLGCLPFSSLQELEALLPEGLLPPLPPPPPATKPVLKPGPSLEPMDQYERENKEAFHRESGKRDNALGQEDWEAVYQAFAKTGAMHELMKRTGMTAENIRHLLDYGVQRLGLPPIREHAVDLREVALRLQSVANTKASGARDEGSCTALVPMPGGKPNEAAEMVHLGDVREAATARATREAMATHGVLVSTLRSTDAMLGYVNRFLERTQDPEGGYDIPEKVDLDHIEALAKAVSNMTRAVDMAVRLSRFTAGEPERCIELEVASIVTRMTSEERKIFIETNVIPGHLRQKTASDYIEAEFSSTSNEGIETSVDPVPDEGDSE
jgi:hypothetical protein